MRVALVYVLVCVCVHRRSRLETLRMSLCLCALRECVKKIHLLGHLKVLYHSDDILNTVFVIEGKKMHVDTRMYRWKCLCLIHVCLFCIYVSCMYQECAIVIPFSFTV